MCLDVLGFFYCSWFLVSCYCIQENVRCSVNLSEFIKNCFVSCVLILLTCGLFLRMSYVDLRIMYILMLWDEMFCEYQSKPSYPVSHLRSLCWFFFLVWYTYPLMTVGCSNPLPWLYWSQPPLKVHHFLNIFGCSYIGYI